MLLAILNNSHYFALAAHSSIKDWTSSIIPSVGLLSQTAQRVYLKSNWPYFFALLLDFLCCCSKSLAVWIIIISTGYGGQINITCQKLSPSPLTREMANKTKQSSQPKKKKTIQIFIYVKYDCLVSLFFLLSVREKEGKKKIRQTRQLVCRKNT